MDSHKSLSELLQEAERVSQELSETRELLKQLKEKRSALVSRVAELRDEKLRLLQEIRTIKSQIRDLKDQRLKIIEEYKRIMEERRSELLQVNALRELINTKTVQYHELSKDIRVPITVLKQKIEEIEWTIQTNVLTPDQENRLIQKLRTYSSILEKALAAKRNKEEVLELKALYISTKTRIQELTVKARNLRETIKEKSSLINNLREKLNTVVTKYNTIKGDLENAKKELRSCNDEITMLTSKLAALREKYQELQREINKAKSLEILGAKRSKISSEIDKRVKKRLTMEELKIMYGELEDLEEN